MPVIAIALPISAAIMSLPVTVLQSAVLYVNEKCMHVTLLSRHTFSNATLPALISGCDGYMQSNKKSSHRYPQTFVVPLPTSAKVQLVYPPGNFPISPQIVLSQELNPDLM